MPFSRQRITNPITGERIVFRRLEDDRLVFEVELRPGGVIAGAPHRHPHEERFRVVRGRFGGWIAGRGALSKGENERFVVPPHVDHVVFNASPRASCAEVEAVPNAGFDRLLESAFDLSHGRVGRVGEVARLMRDLELQLTGIPEGLQERLMGALSSAGSRVPAA